MYRLLDSGNFLKLEQLGPYRLVRPAAQAVWRPRLKSEVWAKVDGSFARSAGGDGRWEFPGRSRLPESWPMPVEGLGTLSIKLTDFGHLGIFPEQHDNWQRLTALVQRGVTRGPMQVLNLFAYTGGSTLAAARGGAEVVHLDASKTSVAWARENAQLSGLGEAKIRWLVDDVNKFVSRELRRGSRYQGIILDPPSYGRGAKGESWKIETDLVDLLGNLKSLLAEDFSFVLLSAHSHGYTPQALSNLLGEILDLRSGELTAAEMLVKEEAAPDAPPPRLLPSGAYALFCKGVQR